MEIRLRRTMLYIPGNNPGMLQIADIFGADSVLFDLEDSVPHSEKDSARDLVSNMIKYRAYENIEITVRVNPLNTPYFEDDVKEIIAAKKLQAIRLPKTNRAEDVDKLAKLIGKYEKENEIAIGTINIHPMIETALGVENAFSIATSSVRVNAITIGGQDLTADMGIAKTKSGEEILWARSRIVMAAKAARIDAVDTIFADINDKNGLIEETRLIKKLGFTGKAVINPRQIEPIHKIFTPTEKEILWAQEVIETYDKGLKEGKGVIALRGKMIDPPVVKRAEKIITISKLGK